ncbi:MAG: ABC transporter ATP-binding protein [Solirubrobacterales bacterium]|nr:ABC transporter ATP-binding protein [Solirubrobacterales bacterium]
MATLARASGTLGISKGPATDPAAIAGGPDPAITVEGVCKTFRLPDHRRSTLKERAMHPFRRIPETEIVAARDLSFRIERGEFFGIVGRNGSGKSTLLKLLTGIYQPDAGRIRVVGRVSPLIELGVGFNHEMAARDNMLLSGALLGLTRSEALRRLDETLEFAGLESYRELQLKNYSSGMLTRLAFSIAIHVDADVLLLDEVLAVGDAGFQEKCYETFLSLKREGKTIVLVTHDMAAVRRFGDRALMLENGDILAIGDPNLVSERYRDTVGMEPGEETEHPAATNRFGDGAADIRDVWMEDDGGKRARTFKPGGQLRICAEISFTEPLQEPPLVFVVRSEDGRNVFSASTEPAFVEGLDFDAGDRILVRMRFENYLGVGSYDVTACVAHRDRPQWADARRDVSSFSIRGDGWSGAVVDLPHQFEIERMGSR